MIIRKMSSGSDGSAPRFASHQSCHPHSCQLKEVDVDDDDDDDDNDDDDDDDDNDDDDDDDDNGDDNDDDDDAPLSLVCHQVSGNVVQLPLHALHFKS